MVVIFINCLGKRPISILVYDLVTAWELAPLFLIHVVQHIGMPESIMSDKGPQFVLDFWDKFCSCIGMKLKLSIANHLQTDS